MLVKKSLEDLQEDFRRHPDTLIASMSPVFQNEFARRWIAEDIGSIGELIRNIQKLPGLDQDAFIEELYRADQVWVEVAIDNFDMFTRADGVHWAKEFSDAVGSNLWEATKRNIEKFKLDDATRMMVLDWIDHLQKEASE